MEQTMLMWMHITLAAAFDLQAVQIWIDVGSIVVTIILAIPTLWPKKRRKRLSYRILSDAALIDEKKDLGEDDIQIMIEGNAVTDVRLIMMQLMNTGSQPIEKNEYEYDNEAKIRFAFNPILSEQPQDTKQVTQPLLSTRPLQSAQLSQSPLVLCALHATKPDGIMSKDQQKKQLKLGTLAASSSPLYDYVDLMGNLMNPGDYMNLKFLTQGKVNITPQGRLVGGSIVPYTPPPQLITPWRVVLIIGLAVMVATFNLGLGSIQGFIQNNCAPSLSTVADGGSTAFYNTALAEKNKYQASCLLGAISVTSSSSGAGLQSLESNQLQIANSELSLKEAHRNYTDLQEHQIAVIVFAIIVNKNLSDITSLTREQITKIYNGDITNWKDLNGPDQAITVIGRPSDSGTHNAFTRFVLNQPERPVSNVPSSTQGVIDAVSADKGAIGYVDLGSANQASATVNTLEIDGNSPTFGLVENDTYRFWAIERMYTKQNADALSLAYINYVTHDIQTDGTFIRLEKIKNGLAAHE